MPVMVLTIAKVTPAIPFVHTAARPTPKPLTVTCEASGN